MRLGAFFFSMWKMAREKQNRTGNRAELSHSDPEDADEMDVKADGVFFRPSTCLSSTVILLITITITFFLLEKILETRS